MKFVLDIGGGHNSYVPKLDEEVTIVDYFAKGDNYIKHNLEEVPYPFPTESFDKIYTSHIIEHLDNLFNVLDQLNRILKDDGVLIIRVPHANLAFNWSHPTHKRLYTSRSLSYLEESGDEKYTKYLWKIKKIELRFNRHFLLGKVITKLANKNKWTQHFFEKTLGIRFDEVYFELKKEWEVNIFPVGN